VDRIEKTVFLSYRRANLPWALAIYQNLTEHGYDVFLDYKGVASGDFEQVILGNIVARAHFIVLLSPSALDRCGESGDWLRREIETALDHQRNVVPLLLEGFDFKTQAIADLLTTGTLAALKNYNAVRVPQDYFDESMERLRSRFLDVPLTAVLHPPSPSARQAAIEQKAAANAAPAVSKEDLAAQEWFERGSRHSLFDEEKVRCFDKAIELRPDYVEALMERAEAHSFKHEERKAVEDLDEVIRLKPDYADAFVRRGVARGWKTKEALADFDEAIRLEPDNAQAHFYRGVGHKERGERDQAIEDFNEAIRLGWDHELTYRDRAECFECLGRKELAIADYEQIIVRFNPKDYSKLRAKLHALHQAVEREDKG
jgi:tetratricopeptide (TPR) repeat protein